MVLDRLSLVLRSGSRVFGRISNGCLGSLAVLGALSTSPAEAGVGDALRLDPRGAYATGGQSAFQAGKTYHFTFKGGETIEYVIDTGDTDVLNGLVKVHELTSNSYPIFEGGLTWRKTAGNGLKSPTNDYYDTPREHATALVTAGTPPVLYHQHLDAGSGVLTLRYLETRSGVQARKSYEFWLAGKVLKVRAYGDGATNSQFINNYDFFEPGRSSLTPSPAEQQIPYMDNAFVVHFAPSTGLPAATSFYSILVDYYQSGGISGDWVIGSPTTPVPGYTDSWEHFYPLVSTLSSATTVYPYSILTTPDETINVTVTKEIEDTFPVIANYRSPYHRLTGGRMMIFGGSNALDSWARYKHQYDAFASWGMDDLFINQYASRKWGSVTLLTATPPDKDFASIMGCSGASIHFSSTPILGLDGTTLYYPVDDVDSATDPYNRNLIATEFGALSDSARNTGALFAAGDCEVTIDQWGTTEERPPSAHAPAAHNSYPVSYPAGSPGWVYGSQHLGIDVSGFTPVFHSDWIVRGSRGKLQGLWDNGAEHPTGSATAWADYGFMEGSPDARHIYDFLHTRLQYGLEHYRANAINLDASHSIPDTGNIDQTAEAVPSSPLKTHSVGDFLKQRTKAVRDLRTYVGGPMYGEADYFRASACYEYGARDGFRDNFPLLELPGNPADISASWVIPDFELREVMPKAAGNSGMGWETQFMPSATPPMDGVDGNYTSFVDAFVTACAIYAHNPLAGSNGHVTNSWWTDEGILREYGYLSGLSRLMHEGTVDKVLYYTLGASPTPYALGDAIRQGIDLKNARIQVTFTNGLVFFANRDLAGSTWTVSVPKLTGGNETIELKKNGFAAGDGTQLFEFFNARPTTGGYSNAFDYCKFVDRWELITNRGSSSSAPGYTGYVYNGFPSSSVTSPFSAGDIDLYSEATLYLDARLGVAVGAHGGLWDGSGWMSTTDGGDSQVTVVSSGYEGIPTHIELASDASTFYTNKPEGVTARAIFSNGVSSSIWQDVTTLSEWSIVSGTATVDQNGAVTATAGSSVTVSAKWTYGASVFTAQLTRTVASGLPTANAGADLAVAPGAAVTFDASTSVDPKSGPVRCEWDFGDGVHAVGSKVDHVFHLTTPRTVALKVLDIEDNSTTDTAVITPNWSSSYLWADSFDDGTLDGYSNLSGDVWGVIDGTAQQSSVASGYRELTVSGQTLGDDSTGAQVKLASPASGSSAGLSVRKTTETASPSTSGYLATLNYASSTSATVSVVEVAGGISNTQTISGFDWSIQHDLRLVSAVVLVHGVNATRLRVYVDGIKRIEVFDSSPPSSGYTGLVTSNVKAQFDDLRATNSAAPYSTVTPLEPVAGGSPSTQLTFFIDDQDFFSDINTGSVALTITALDGASAGSPSGTVTYNWSALSTTPVATGAPVYETGSSATSTWAKFTLATTVESRATAFGAGTKTVAYELLGSDASGKTGRKYVVYRLP